MRGGGSGQHASGDAGRRAASHVEPRRPGSGVRSRLRPRRGPPFADRMGRLQLHRIWQQELGAGAAQPELTFPDLAARYNLRSPWCRTEPISFVQPFGASGMRNCCGIALIVMLLAAGSSARQQSSKKPQPQPQTEPAAAPQDKAGKPPAQPAQPTPKPEENKPAAGDESKSKDLHFDMTEVAPIVTHHQISMNGRVLRYTATAGRLPIKREDGKIEAEMFFVAYTLDGQDAGRRPLTFAFNGGPGSASVWLHMGALGPKRVMLTSEGFMPPAPYRMEDNQSTLLDRSDLVLVDAIGTGFSRAADLETSKKFWGMKGDIEAYGEFIRMFLTRYDRWTSPLFMLGESYGTTRAAGVAGYLADKGIAFSGITLL